MNPVDLRLRAALASGPQQSRDVLAALAAEGITPKQLRRARENIGVEVTRRGRREDMRSFWSLPADMPDAAGTVGEVSSCAHCSVVRNGDAPTPCQPGDQVAPRPADAELQEFERERIANRVKLFAAKGLDPSTAQQVALMLTIHRDRPGVRGGSCAECQSMRSPTACISADAGFAEGPRPVTEVWSCGYARLGGT